MPTPSTPRHRTHGRSRPGRLSTGRRAWWPVAGLVALLMVVVTLAVSPGREGRDDRDGNLGGADTDTTAGERPAVDPVIDPVVDRVANPVRLVDAPTRATDGPRTGSTAPKSLPTYRVLPAPTLRLKSTADREAKKALGRAREDEEDEKVQVRDITLRIGTFNVLGSQHTRAGGDHPRYPPAARRSVGAVEKLRAHGVEILGLQEAQNDQLGALQRATGWAAFPGEQFGYQETDNSIIYDTDRFEFVSGTSFTITFMNGQRPQTVLRLRDRPTGREFYVVNMHASAGEGRYAVSRRAGHLAAIEEVNRLRAEGLPVFLLGDMNDREEFFCRVAPAAALVAAIGGSGVGGCRPARALAVDWVLGTASDVTFSDYAEDRSTLGRISDHHFVSATATVRGSSD